MNIFFKYILFCILATFVNLTTQRIIIELILIDYYFTALLCGTLTGLITKYTLDKKYIFKDLDNSLKNNTKKFTLYSFNGIFTTIIFWASESLFYFTYATNFSRELGAIIGLAIGYFFKYKLDKKYVFHN